MVLLVDVSEKFHEENAENIVSKSYLIALSTGKVFPNKHSIVAFLKTIIKIALHKYYWFSHKITIY